MIRALDPLQATALPALLFLLWLPLYAFVRPEHARRFFLFFSLVTLVLVAGPALTGGFLGVTLLSYAVIERVARLRRARGVGLAGLWIALHAGYWACFHLPLPAAFRPPMLDTATGPGVFIFFSGIALVFLRIVSYAVERCRGAPAMPLFDFAAWMLYFPQARHGPLERAHAFAPQLRTARSSWTRADVRAGLLRAALGLGIFMLVVGGGTYALRWLSPGYASVAPAGSSRPSPFVEPQCYSLATLLLLIHTPALVLYALESAFASIQLGVSRAFGVRGTENFRYPFLARSPRELWHGWNITFSTWLRDYCYIPLGGNRRHQALNILITFVYCGLLHGLQWRCLAWGVWTGGTLALFTLIAGLWGGGRRAAPVPASVQIPSDAASSMAPPARVSVSSSDGVAWLRRLLVYEWFSVGVVIILDAEHCGWRLLSNCAQRLLGLDA